MMKSRTSLSGALPVQVIVLLSRRVTTYSAYLEVRDTNGDPIAPANLVVTNLMTASTVTPEENGNYKIHNNDLTTSDFSMSLDNKTGILYLFCTAELPEGLHAMKFRVVSQSPINGDCGSSDGGTFTSAPTTDLCNDGDATAVTGSGPWSWTCTGINSGATDDSCSAQIQAVNGTCGSSNGGTFASAPNTNLCSAGNATTVLGSGPWNWTCTGIGSGTTATCSANIQAVNGVCGSSNGGTFTEAPSTNLCSVGNATTVTGSGPWNWTCTGIGTGTTANCSANAQGSGTPDLGFPVTTYGSVTGVSGSSTSNNVPFNQTITIRNTGNANAGSFTVKTYISTSTVLGSNAELLDTWNVSGLAAGQTLVHTATQSYSGKSVHAYYYMIVKVDADDRITESNEAVCGSRATQGCNTFAYQFFVYR